MAQSFHSLTIDNILDKETNKNKADIFCPKDNCNCLILRKNTAVLVTRDGGKVSSYFKESLYISIIYHLYISFVYFNINMK